MKRRVIFESSAFEDFTEWTQLDKKLHKIVELLKDIDRFSVRRFRKARTPQARLKWLLATAD